MSEKSLPKISIIIPAYNSAGSIERAVKSALSQTYADIEVVVVNDGSSDATEEIVKSMADKDPRVRLFTKENAGVSAARNDGIMAAQGEWFVTLDADDYIDRDMIEALYEAVERTDADTVLCGFRMVYEDGKKSVFKVDDDYTDEKATFLDEMFVELYDKHMISTHSNQLFNMKLVRMNRILYDEKLAVNEDIDYVLRYLRFCKSIGVIKGAYLNYVQQDEGKSLNTTFQSYGVASSLLVLRDYNELFEGIEASDETIDDINNRMFMHICSFVGLMYYRSDYSDERKLAEIRELCEKEEFDDLLEDLKPNSVKNSVAAWLLRNGLFKQYHSLCLRLYKGQQKLVTNKPDEESTPDTAYRLLDIYSDVNASDSETYKKAARDGAAEKGSADSELHTDNMSESVDTDVIMKALEKSAEDMAEKRPGEAKSKETLTEKKKENTSVTMEDILTVREILSEKKC